MSSVTRDLWTCCCHSVIVFHHRHAMTRDQSAAIVSVNYCNWIRNSVSYFQWQRKPDPIRDEAQVWLRIFGLLTFSFQLQLPQCIPDHSRSARRILFEHSPESNDTRNEFLVSSAAEMNKKSYRAFCLSFETLLLMSFHHSSRYENWFIIFHLTKSV